MFLNKKRIVKALVSTAVLTIIVTGLYGCGAGSAKTAVSDSKVNSGECISMARDTAADALHPYIGGLVYALPQDMQGMPVRAWNGDEPFFNDGRPLKEAHLEEYRYYGATDIFTNIPERYV